jgi:hypothetical protein
MLTWAISSFMFYTDVNNAKSPYIYLENPFSSNAPFRNTIPDSSKTTIFGQTLQPPAGDDKAEGTARKLPAATQSRFPKLVTCVQLRLIGVLGKSNNSECYTPSPEPLSRGHTKETGNRNATTISVHVFNSG